MEQYRLVHNLVWNERQLRLDNGELGKVLGLESKGMTAGMSDARLYEGMCCLVWSKRVCIVLSEHCMEIYRTDSIAKYIRNPTPKI